MLKQLPYPRPHLNLHHRLVPSSNVHYHNNSVPYNTVHAQRRKEMTTLDNPKGSQAIALPRGSVAG